MCENEKMRPIETIKMEGRRDKRERWGVEFS
jgi:hypothetical protein